MSSVDKMPNGKWRARWRTPDGASRSRNFTRKADAEKHLTGIEHRKLSGEYVDSATGRVTFGEYARSWVAAQPHRPSTAASLESMMKVHMIPAFGDRSFGKIRPSDVQAFITGLPLAPTTVRTVYAKLSAIFAAAVLDRVIASSPCTRAIKLPRLHGGEITPMDPSEVRTVIDAVDERYAALFLLMAGTGLRPGEALGVTVDRVEFLKRTIRIDRQLTTITSVAEFAPVKTAASNRTVAVPDSVLDALAAHIRRFGTGRDGLLFTTANGQPIRRDQLGYAWRVAAKAAGIVDRTPHDLRHFAASVMIENGASVKAVQRQLGHEKATTTLDTYAHLWSDAEDVTRRALEVGVAAVVSHACHEASSGN